MTREELMDLIRSGEDSGTQFKTDVRNAQSLASEMAAFSNSRGGEILIGVTDTGVALGLETEDVHRINQLISNAASQLVRSPLNVHTENLLLENDRVVIVVTIEEGRDKPYFDKNGVIWLKNGADKRRVNSKEELRRIFQSVDLLHADELTYHLTVEKIRAGNSVIRNPILASFAAKGLLPYRGLGTGVRRALQECPELQFAHDPEAETFTATIPLSVPNETENEPVEIDVSPLQVQLLNLIRENPDTTYDGMAEATGKGRSTIRRHIKTLRENNLLRRVGSDRHGHWEVME
ncbi:MAG: RNA-binding domain-containing protein [Kiritimatiellia bacterium]